MAPSSQQPTISQPLLQKIEIVDDRVILAGTGAVGLAQRFVDITEKAWETGYFKNNSAIDVGRNLSQSTISDFRNTGVPAGQFGAIVAASIRGEATLIEFTLDLFQPEIKTSDNWYVSMGSGQQVADPLLGFIRTAFWGDRPPSCQDGVFAMAFVLKLGCAMAPFGVSGPIAVLNRERKGKLAARRLSKEELFDHESYVTDAIEFFGSYKEKIHKTDASVKTPPKA